MRLEEIYNILKNCSLEDFYIPQYTAEQTFVYRDDVKLSITKVKEEEPIYDYDYFFNKDRTDKTDLNEYEKFIQELCKVDIHLACAGSIRQQYYDVKYNGEVIYVFCVVNIYNPSSINFTVPNDIKAFDVELNFCHMINEDAGASKYWQAESIIEQKVMLKDSTYEEFFR